MDSIQDSTPTTHANTTFLDEAPIVPVTVETASGRSKISAKGLMTDISESDWDLPMMLSKPIRITTVTWTTSQAAGQFLNVVGTLPHPLVPRDILNNNLESMQTNLLKSYMFGRYTPVFTLQLNSTKFNNGRLWFGYVPISEFSDSAYDLNNFTVVSMYPHVEIDAANSSPVELTMPWFHPQSSFNHTIDEMGERSLGFPFLYVFSQLSVPTGATTSLDVTIFMHLENAELHVPVNPALTYFSPKPPALHRRRYRFADEDNEAHGIFDSIGSLWTNVQSIASDVGSALDHAVNLDFSEAAGDFGRAIDTGMTTVEENPELLSLLMDRPICLKTEVMVPRQMGPIAYGIGSDTSTRLDITPFSQYRPNSFQFSGFQSDHNLLDIAKRWSTIRRLTWSSSIVTGTSLDGIFVHPIHSVQTGSIYSPSYLAHISSAFVRWRGSIDFRVSIIATQFHSGRLMLVFTNGYFGDLTMDEATNFPNVILDLHNADNRDYVFSCKYNSTMPMLRTQYHQGAGQELDSFTLLGRFRIFVLNQLTHTESIATSINIQIDIRAGEDFIFETPRRPDAVAFADQVVSNVIYSGGQPSSATYRGIFTEITPPTVVFPPLYPNPVFVDNEAHGVEDIPSIVLLLKDLEDTLILTKEKVLIELTTIGVIKTKVNAEARFYPKPSEYSSKLTAVSNLMTNLESLRSKIEVSFTNMLNFASTAEQLLANLPPPPDNEPHALEDPTASAEMQVNLQQGEKSALLPHSHVATSVTSDVRDVVRRYGLGFQIFFRPNLDARGTTLYLPVSPIALMNPESNLLAWFSLMFRGWSGSLRYKLLFLNSQIDTQMVNVTHFPDLYTPTDSYLDSARTEYPGGYACKIVNTTDAHAIEFEVPFKSNLHFLLTSRVYATGPFHRYAYNGSIGISLNDYWKIATSDRQMPLACQLFIAAGDDFNFHFPIPPPVGTFNPSYNEVITPVPYTTTTVSSVNTTTTSQASGLPSFDSTFVNKGSIVSARCSPPRESQLSEDEFEDIAK